MTKVIEVVSRRLSSSRRFGLTLLLFATAGTACRCSPKAGGDTPAPNVNPPAPEPPSSAETALLDVDTGCPAMLAETRTGGTRPGSFVAPSDADMAKAKSALTKLLKGGDVAADAKEFGFEVVPLEGWPDAVLLREMKDRRHGGGAYVVRKGSSSNLLVQAPHTFFDEGTFPLACELFQRTKARALYINTAHRYKASPPGGDRAAADVAHSPQTLFQAATEGAADAVSKISVVQLHGFADRKLGGRAVVSTGEKNAGSPYVAKVAAALEAVVGPKILKYPEDTSELGATTNVQGAVIRRAGGRFLHIEMADGLRRDLGGNASLRAKALDALAAVVANAGP
jgi:hypothetical protein